MLKTERVIRGPGGTAANSYTEQVREESAGQSITPVVANPEVGLGNANPTLQTGEDGIKPVVDYPFIGKVE